MKKLTKFRETTTLEMIAKKMYIKLQIKTRILFLTIHRVNFQINNYKIAYIKIAIAAPIH